MLILPLPRAPPSDSVNVAVTGTLLTGNGDACTYGGAETHWASLNFSADFIGTNGGVGKVDFPEIKTTVSRQKQNRHVAGSTHPGGQMASRQDAQKVLDAYHSGNATIIGRHAQGHPIVKFEGVTGTNINKGANITNQPTNVFMIKGTNSPSIVPINPNWKP